MGRKLGCVPPICTVKVAQPVFQHSDESAEEELLYKVLEELRILVYSNSQSVFLCFPGVVSIYTMGEPAKDTAPPFAYPFDFDLAFQLFGQPLQSRSRSELSNAVVDDVADSAAIFCSAFRRMFLDALKIAIC